MAENVVIQPNVSSQGTAFTNSFFRNYPVDLRYLKTIYQTIHPTNAIAKSPMVNFKLDAWHNNTFYVLDKIVLMAKFRLVKGDRSIIGQTDEQLGVANNVLHTAFQDVKVYFNELNINPYSNHYNYKQYIEATISCSQEAKRTILRNAGYYTDTAGEMNTMTDENVAFHQRANWFRKELAQTPPTPDADTPPKFDYDGRECTFTDLLRLDLENVPPLINGVTVRFEMRLAPAQFPIMTASTVYMDYILEMTHIQLLVPSVILEPTAYESIQSLLNNHRLAQYSFRRRHIQHMVIVKGLQHFVSETLFPASIAPSRLVLGFVSEPSFHGERTQNPYNFLLSFDGGHTTVENVNLTLNGTVLDGLPTNSKHIWYHRLFQFTGLRDHGLSNGITPEQFEKGYGLIVFDLSTSLSANTVTLAPAIRSGFLRLEVDFSTILADNIVAVLWCEFPSLITIDANRNVSTNFLQSGYTQ